MTSLANHDTWITGKSCLVTGANAGIGKEIARGLAFLGARVVMACRDETKGRAAMQEIVESTGNASVDVRRCDLASLHDVERFARQFQEEHDALHVLVNNAGIFSQQRAVSADGYELTVAVDYLAHFHLTMLLLPLLGHGAPARIVNLASDIHNFFGVSFDDFLSEKRYNAQRAYSNAKGAMVLLARRLARTLDPAQITINAVHPGHARTKMTTEGLPRWFVAITSPFQVTAAEAAKTPLHVATSASLTGVSGAYFKNCKEAKPAKYTADARLQDALLDKSIELVAAATGTVHRITGHPRATRPA